MNPKIHSYSQEDLLPGHSSSSDSRRCLSELSKSNSFHPFQNFKALVEEVKMGKKQVDQFSDLKPPTVFSQDFNSRVALSSSNQKIKLDQSQQLQLADQLITPKQEEQLVSPKDPQVQKKEIKDIIVPNQKMFDTKPSKSNMNFIQLLLTKRIINNFKDNLLSKAYILPKKISATLQKLLQEEYIKKKERIKKKRKQQQLQIKKVSKGLTQFIMFGLKAKKKKLKLSVFDPTSKIIIIWESIKIFFIILFFWWVPFQLSFQAEITDLVKQIQIWVLVFFSLDILIKLNKAYISLGQIVRERKQILLHYLSSEALVDCSSLMCISIYIRFQDSLSRLLICSILIIYFILNITKINRSLSKISESFSFQNLISESLALLKLILVIFFFAHIIACIWHFVGSLHKQTGISWITVYQLEDEGIWTLYNYSFYWATMTMVTVGYGDITPKNNLELICANMTMFVACGVFAFSINAIGIVLQNINEGKAKFKRTLNLINNYMNINQVQFEMQSRVRNYLEYCFDQENEINDEEVQFIRLIYYMKISNLIGKLSINLKQDLLYAVLSKVIQNCKVISANFSETTQKAIACRMESYRISPQEKIIYNQQDTLDDCSLYIIQKGEIKIIEEKSKKVLKVLKKGESFGEYSFFTGLSRTCSAMSEDFSRVYKIPRDIFLQVIKDEQEDKVEKQYENIIQEQFYYLKDQLIFSQKYDSVNMKCYACNQQNHISVNCRSLLFIPDMERLIKKDLFPVSERLEYLRVQRKSKIKHSLAHLKIIQERGKGIAEQQLDNEMNEEDEESQKSINYTTTNMISMVNAIENENRSNKQKNQQIFSQSEKKIDDGSFSDLARSSQQKGTAEFKVRSSMDEAPLDILQKGKIQFLRVVEEDYVSNSRQKISDFEVEGRSPRQEHQKEQHGRQSRKKKTITEENNVKYEKHRQDEGLKSPMKPALKQNTKNKTFMPVTVRAIDEQNEDDLIEDSQNRISLRRISTYKTTQQSLRRQSSPAQQTVVSQKLKEKTYVSRNEEEYYEENYLDEEQEICSYEIDTMQIYKIYYPQFNFDIVCRKLLKMQLRTFPLKKTSHQNNFLSGKYTFFHVVKKRAQKLRYYIKRQQLGILESKRLSPRRSNIYRYLDSNGEIKQNTHHSKRMSILSGFKRSLHN